MRAVVRRSAAVPAILLTLLCLLLATSAGAAQAIVPPQDCGMLTVDGRRYNIKADQIRCSTAKPYARRYLASNRRPSGYRCQRYSSQTKLKFRCSRGIKVFFAIKR